jgi:hypothetical protein
MRWVLAVAFAAGCYSPSIPTGASCDKDHPCPRPLICTQATSTCERSEIDAAIDDAEQPPDAFVPPIDAPPMQGCIPTGFDVCNDGFDQDCDGADEVCAANDLAADAKDVTAGITETADLNLARDHAPQRGCGNDGGRDLFYKVTLTAPQVYYFDTFGSNFDTTVRVFPGKQCTAITMNDNPSCSDDACGGPTSQLALELPSGTSCIVVDQNLAAMQGALRLEVKPGGHFGQALMAGPRTITGDTCGSTDQWRPPCAGTGGKEHAWFYTACPGATAMVDASTCSDVANTHFDTALYIRRAGQSTPLVCVDDTSSCAARPERLDHPDGAILTGEDAMGPGLFFLILDGYDTGACGGYSMTVNLH